MSKHIQTDPLASDRTLNTSRIDVSAIDFDHSEQNVSVSLYDAFSFSKASTSKIASQRQTTRIRNLKGNLTIKNSNIFELMKMLALCENKYKTDVSKMASGISRTIFLNAVGVTGLMATLRPVIKSAVRCVKSTYLYRWKANSGYQIVRKPIFKKKAHAKTIFSIVRRLTRRSMIKSFIEIRERTSMGISIKRRKPSVRSPVEIRSPIDLRSQFDLKSSVDLRSQAGSKSPADKREFERKSNFSPNKSISNMSITSERQVDERTRKEFKQSIQSKYKPENKPLERAMGSSYFRNN